MLRVVLISLLSMNLAYAASLPKGFVYLDEIAPTISVELAYYGTDNFVGRRVDGYAANRAILTQTAARKLADIQAELEEKGLGLKIFDAYRPKRAVRHFYRWSQDRNDLITKSRYYPDISKRELFRQGYIARRSSHSRGSTVDLTLVDLSTGGALDMGSAFDFFGPVSGTNSKRISPKQRANRKLLRNLMRRHGFKPYRMEWWHFTLRNEPYPRRSFDFEIQ